MGKPLRTGPTALTTSAANIMQGAGGDASMRDRIKAVHVSNRTTSDATFSMYLGLTGATTAGTGEWEGKKVLANDVYDWYGDVPLASTEYLVALASANSSLTITITYEREVI